MTGGPYKLKFADGDLMVFVEGPKYSKGFFNIPDDLNEAQNMRDVLNRAYLEGYSDGYADGKDQPS